MKILPRAFILSVFFSFFVSAAVYFILLFLCKSFAPFLLSFVFLISVITCVTLFYLSSVHFCTFSAVLKGERLVISKGFIIKRKIIIKLGSVISAKNVSTPLMRLLGLNNILLLSEGNVCVLPLLKAEDAEHLYREILKISEKNEKL